MNNKMSDRGKPSSPKYSRDKLLSPKKMRKGVTRWNQFEEALQKNGPDTLAGPILDFGSGVGYFVLEGLRRDMDIWGVDFLPGKIMRYKMLIDYTGSAAKWAHRCTVGDGLNLPFAAGHFAAISSWYVFEHIPDPARVIRELVRVTRKNGIIAIRAQDARNGWEGHCKIPWVPFLPNHLERAWIEEFGSSLELREGVYDVTQPQCEAIFRDLNCRIVMKAAEPKVLIEDHWTLETESQVRTRARQIRTMFDNGEWRPQPENLYIFAKKN